MKRSSCASGSGYVPSCSIGFCVAITMNGVPRVCVSVSTVTCRSSMHSSNADWVFGDARLISSPSTMLAKIAPGLELEVTRLLAEDVDAGDIRRQEVGCELDPPERTVDRPGDRLREHRFADAGHVLDQQMALGDQRDQRQPDLLVLAPDHPFDVLLDLTEPSRERPRIRELFSYLHQVSTPELGVWSGVQSYGWDGRRVASKNETERGGGKFPTEPGDRRGESGPAHERTPRAAPIRNDQASRAGRPASSRKITPL